MYSDDRLPLQTQWRFKGSADGSMAALRDLRTKPSHLQSESALFFPPEVMAGRNHNIVIMACQTAPEEKRVRTSKWRDSALRQTT